MRRRFLSSVALLVLTGLLTRADERRDSRSRDPLRPLFDSHGDPLPQGPFARLGVARFRKEARSKSVHVSPNGAMLAFDDLDGHVRLCYFPTDREIYRLDGSFGSFSLDGKRMAIIRPDSTIEVRDITTYKKADRLTGHSANSQKQLDEKHAGKEGQEIAESRTLRIALWPDGNTLASFGSDETVRIWDVVHGKELARHKFKGLGLRDSFSPDGKTLARIIQPEQVELWSLEQ